jgi:uncharacterized delta-60 repeat protein
MSHASHMRRRPWSRRRPAFFPQTESLEGRQLLTGPGTLDTSFGQGGSALAGPGIGRQVEVQRVNGQDYLLVAGDNGGDIRITRLLLNGATDTSFGTSGSVPLDFAGKEDSVRDLLVLPDGRFIVAGNANTSIQVGTKGGKPVYYTTQDFAVAVFHADGSPDNSFSGDGKATFNISANTANQSNYRNDSLNDAEVLDDGSILLAGSSLNPDGQRDASLIKVTPGGSLDPAFGNAGLVEYRLPGYDSTAIWDLAVLRGATSSPADDQILVLDTPSNNSVNYWAIGLARFTASGQLDTTYGTNGGRTITAATDSLPVWKMAVRQDGSVIVTGRIDYAGGVSPSDGFLASYTSSGLPDTGFGTGGLATFDINGGDAGYAVAIDPGPTTSPADDKVYVTGSCQGGNTGFVARFDGNTGHLDPTFGTNGIVLQQGLSYDLAIQSDGQVVTVTTRSTSTKQGTTYQFLVYRYNGN